MEMKVMGISQGFVGEMDRLLDGAGEALTRFLHTQMSQAEQAHWVGLTAERQRLVLLEAFALRIAERLREAGFLQDHLEAVAALMVEVWVAEEDSRDAKQAGRVM